MQSAVWHSKRKKKILDNFKEVVSHGSSSPGNRASPAPMREIGWVTTVGIWGGGSTPTHRELDAITPVLNKLEKGWGLNEILSVEALFQPHCTEEKEGIKTVFLWVLLFL